MRIHMAIKLFGVTCKAVTAVYGNGATALLIKDAVTGEPMATASVNVPGISEHLAKDECIIKTYSENEGILEELERAHVVARTPKQVPTGLINCPIVRIL